MANRLQTARDFNPYAPGVTMEELQQIRRQLAKVMNQRMVRLENTVSPKSGEAYTFGGYDVMQDYLKDKGRKAVSETKGARFSEVMAPKGMTKSDLQKEIRAMQNFESMPSTRISGMHAIERKRIETFTNPDPTITKRKALSEKTVSNKDFYDFLNSKTYEELAKSFSSDILVEEYDRAARKGLTKTQIQRALNEYMQNSKKMSIKGIRRKLSARTIKKKSSRKRK